jgi:hypothetical protein
VCVRARVRARVRGVRADLVSTLNTEEVRTQDEPLDKLLAIDMADTDWITRLKPSRMLRKAAPSKSVPALWQVQHARKLSGGRRAPLITPSAHALCSRPLFAPSAHTL